MSSILLSQCKRYSKPATLERVMALLPLNDPNRFQSGGDLPIAESLHLP
jgi:hypothetical protein